MLLMYNDLLPVIQKYNPDVIAIETQYFFRNVRTLRSLAESVGAIKLTALLNSRARICEFEPTKIKRAATEKGNAKKDVVKEAVCKMFNLPSDIPDDQSDAIACVLTYIKEEIKPENIQYKKNKGWVHGGHQIC